MKKLGAFLGVKNMISNNGNDIANQFIIYFENGRVFQSYQSIIAVEFNNGNVYIGKDWDYSITTGKYRNMFLGEDKKETQEELDNGVYLMIEE